MKLLFHSCCAPCSIESINSLYAEGIEPALFWYNPNIHPLSEYQNRRDALTAFSAAQKLPLEMPEMTYEFGLELFLQSVGHAEMPGRCEICYRIRLEKNGRFCGGKWL
jgi:predicted adenine nucleotide alpha hydrolase (AANH) superfamily ATPase